MDQIKGGGLGKSAERKLRTGDAQTALHMNTRGQEPKMYSPEEYAKYGLEKGPLGLPVPQGWRVPRRLEFGQEQQQSSAPDGNISPCHCYIKDTHQGCREIFPPWFAKSCGARHPLVSPVENRFGRRYIFRLFRRRCKSTISTLTRRIWMQTCWRTSFRFLRSERGLAHLELRTQLLVEALGNAPLT